MRHLRKKAAKAYRRLAQEEDALRKARANTAWTDKGRAKGKQKRKRRLEAE